MPASAAAPTRTGNWHLVASTGLNGLDYPSFSFDRGSTFKHTHEFSLEVYTTAGNHSYIDWGMSSSFATVRSIELRKGMHTPVTMGSIEPMASQGSPPSRDQVLTLGGGLVRSPLAGKRRATSRPTQQITGRPKFRMSRSLLLRTLCRPGREGEKRLFPLGEEVPTATLSCLAGRGAGKERIGIATQRVT